MPTPPLVQADELMGLVGAPGLVLADVSFRLGSPGWGREQYLAGHLPGARFVDVDAELADPPAPAAPGAHPDTHPGGRHPLPSPARFAATCRRLGVDENSLVVAYDQGSSLAAARLWWLLCDAGHPRVRVLDGGVAAWRAAGGELSTIEPGDGEGGFQRRPGRLPVVHAGQLRDELAAGHRLFDVRAAERFEGLVEPVDPVAGHLPGASNLPAGSLQGPDGRFLPAPELAVRLEPVRAGDVLSCGSGLTASQVLLACEQVGTTGARLYPGSWSDWISDPARL